MTWNQLGRNEWAALARARVELHWATQVVSATADRWLPRVADDSHTSMAWDTGRRALVGNTAASGIALALVVDELALVVLRGDDIVERHALADGTLKDALAWADDAFAKAAGEGVRGVAVRDYDMPEHAVRDGAKLTRDAGALAELAAWYSGGVDVLASVAAMPGAVPLRVWPHHFDLGTIVFLDAAGERARQIGVGLSPGDRYYPEPYFYITPHPIAKDASFPALAGGGTWRREDWTGAVLQASVLVAGDAATRRDRAAAFVTSAIDGARGVIGA